MNSKDYQNQIHKLVDEIENLNFLIQIYTLALYLRNKSKE